MRKMHGNNWFERNPKTTLFILLIVVFVVSIFTIEKYLAIMNKTTGISKSTVRYIVLREYQPLSSFKWTISDDFIKSTDSPIEKKELATRLDENGFIEPSKIYENPDITLAFLGGSTTELLCVQEKNKFPYLVGRIIEKSLNKKVNSYNASLNGNHSIHSINTLVNEVIPLKPDAVIMEHNMNDLIQLLYMEDDYWCSGPRTLLTNEHAMRAAALRSVIYITIPNLYMKIRHSKIVSSICYALLSRDAPDEWAGVRGKKLKIDKEDLVSNFKSSLQTFVGICKAWGIKPVLLTQQNRLKENPDRLILEDTEKKLGTVGVSYQQFKELFDLSNQTIREVAKENNILLVDLAKKIPQEKEYMRDQVHLVSKGSQLAAKIISEKLLKILD